MNEIGLYGGAFDPPHLGHVALAHAAKRHFGLPRLIVLVAAAPGHKRTQLPAETRLELARVAFPDEDVRLDDHPRTVDLLRDGKWHDPLFLVGADEFCDFLSWKEPNDVLRLARLGVATRPGFPRERLQSVLDRLEAPDRVTFFEIEPHDVASSKLRALIASGRPLDELVPEAVAAVIKRRGLYRP
jgi:nicotinate-nucleotide adenylyltransferase